MDGDIDVHMKQQCVTEFMNAENIVPVEVHQCLKNVYEEMTLNVSTVRQWFRHGWRTCQGHGILTLQNW
jgi:hypothetical protein